MNAGGGEDSPGDDQAPDPPGAKAEGSEGAKAAGGEGDTPATRARPKPKPPIAPTGQKSRSKDRRRHLPTTDFLARPEPANLRAVAEKQSLAASHFYAGLTDLRADFATNILRKPVARQVPTTLTGTARLPDGRPAAEIAVSVQPFTDENGKSVVMSQMDVSDAHGFFKLSGLPHATVAAGAALSLQFRGANGKEQREFDVDQLTGDVGLLGDVHLKLDLAPLQQSVIASLMDVVGGLAPQPQAEPVRPGTADKPITLALGDGECRLDFSHDMPVERFRYSMLVRLVEPRPSVQTETVTFSRNDGAGDFTVALRNESWADGEGSTRSFRERVPIDQPISVDGFRDAIIGYDPEFMGGGDDFEGPVAGISPDETVPMAGTLGLGYVLHMAQSYTPQGLSLGDLVYSLPLAPGEQQRLAVFEQRQTLTAAETESLDFAEQQRASQESDSSTESVFNSAFAEHIRGTSSYSTQAESSSWGVAGGVGASIGFLSIGVGAAGGGGSSSSSGRSSNSLSGTRDYLSTAASHAHSSVERQASARRHAQRTGMRMATASDVETVTTRVIANNNRIHALTMQYWEVLRHFEVKSVVDGVTLVCFVPLQVIRFLPAYQPYALTESALQTRHQILVRYEQLIKHSDVLMRWIPSRYRQGLRVLEEFASNPRAAPALNSPQIDIIEVKLRGSFIPTEDIFVTVLTRRGTRLGPVRFSGQVPQLPDTTTDPTKAFTSKTQLVTDLLRRRTPGKQDTNLTASVTLPSSLSPHDVIGFRLSRQWRTLKYDLAQTETNPFGPFGGESGAPPSLLPWLLPQLDAQINGVTMGPGELEAELGGPSIFNFSASISNMQQGTFALNEIASDERFPLPADGYPIAAQAVNPLLKYDELLKIEAALQHVARNTVTYSRAVWMSLTPEERAIMLEGFTIGVPADGETDQTQDIPLLNCVANQILGYYGNAMVMPFNIPAEMSTLLTVGDDRQGEEPRPFTSAEVQKALTEFHRTGFSPPVSHVTLPTRGVLGEAVLGQCPSAEKIDLTRFWNWGDSPIAQAADIAENLLNRGSSLIGATAPNTLAGMPSSITNINAPPADASAALQALIAGRDTRDLPDITGSKELAALQGKTLDTAESARKDALNQAGQLASKGLDKASEIMKARADSEKEERAREDRKQTDAKQSDAAAKQVEAKQKSEADAARATKTKEGAAAMKTDAKTFLAVADSKGDQAAADKYAKQLVQQVFGSETVPIDVASSLFTDYRQFAGGDPKKLTQGSTAFLKALGL